MSRKVVLVGAGIAGLSCARVIADSGIEIQVVDRGRGIGGRMSSYAGRGRAVDLGASYFTARDPDFAALVDTWRQAGLARPWTDTFAVADAHGITGSKTGDLRWASYGGLRSLMERLADGLPVETRHDVEGVGVGPTVDGELVDCVVLAMPDPQAGDILSEELVAETAVVSGATWAPVIAMAAAWDERCWADFDGMFVNGHPQLGWVADDGARRGDLAPVLVAHSTPAFAADHLDEPAAAAGPLLTAVQQLLGIDEPPSWTYVRRWSLAKPTAPHAEPFHLGDAMVGLCGDGWHAPSRVEAAWLSGRDLGRAVVERLA